MERSELVKARLTPPEMVELTERANAAGMSVSAFVRQLIVAKDDLSKLQSTTTAARPVSSKRKAALAEPSAEFKIPKRELIPGLCVSCSRNGKAHWSCKTCYVPPTEEETR